MGVGLGVEGAEGNEGIEGIEGIEGRRSRAESRDVEGIAGKAGTVGMEGGIAGRETATDERESSEPSTGASMVIVCTIVGTKLFLTVSIVPIKDSGTRKR
jgi:hypothetical protein